MRKKLTLNLLLFLFISQGNYYALDFTFPSFPTVDFTGCTDNACMIAKTQSAFDSYIQTASDDLANQLDSNFGEYAKTFGKHYGQAAILTNHSMYPIGKDNMGIFPSFYGGLGLGTAFGNADAVKTNAPDDLKDVSILPAFGLSFNTGFGLTKKWDLRLGFFPVVDFAMPSDLNSGMKVSFKYGSAKAKLGYHVLDGGAFKPGFTTSGYLSYTSGTLAILADEASYSDIIISQAGPPQYDATVKPTYQWGGEAKWRYVGLGAEFRLWFDMLFLVPYIGYGVGFNFGKFTTEFNVDSDVLLTGASVDIDGGGATPATAVDDMTSSANTKFSKSSSSDLMLHRVFLGLEMHIALLTIGTEVQFDIGNRLAGASIGAAFQF